MGGFFWLCWDFIAAQAFSLVAASGACSPVMDTGSRCTGSVVVVSWFSCCGACGIPDQGSHYVSCIGRWILYHRATRKTPLFSLSFVSVYFFFFDFFSDLLLVAWRLASVFVCCCFFNSSFAVSDVISHFSPAIDF